MRRAALPVLLFCLASGCASPPPSADASAEAAEPAPAAQSQDWVIVRDFAFTLENGQVVPVVGSSHSSYKGLYYACTLFDLPALRRLTLWLNSTPDDLASGSVGGVTFDLRYDDGSLTNQRREPTLAGPRSYVLSLEDVPAGHYHANFKAELATFNGHAEGRYILEGTGLYDDGEGGGEVPGLMDECRKDA